MNEDWREGLTEEELFEKWEGIIHKCLHERCPSIHSWDPDGEDLYQECSIALLRCIRSYDPSTGFKFATLAYCAINRSISNWFLTNKYRTAEHHLKPLSIDLLMENKDGREYGGASFEDKSAAIDILYLDDWLNSLTEKQRTIVEMRMAGYTFSEIGERLGCSKQCVQSALTSERDGAVRKKYDLYVTKI